VLAVARNGHHGEGRHASRNSHTRLSPRRRFRPGAYPGRACVRRSSREVELTTWPGAVKCGVTSSTRCGRVLRPARIPGCPRFWGIARRLLGYPDGPVFCPRSRMTSSATIPAYDCTRCFLVPPTRCNNSWNFFASAPSTCFIVRMPRPFLDEDWSAEMLFDEPFKPSPVARRRWSTAHRSELELELVHEPVGCCLLTTAYRAHFFLESSSPTAAKPPGRSSSHLSGQAHRSTLIAGGRFWGYCPTRSAIQC